MNKQQKIKLIFVILLSVISSRFLSIINDIVNIVMISNMNGIVASYILMAIISIGALGVFVLGLLSIIKKENRKLFLILTIVLLAILISFNVYFITQAAINIKNVESLGDKLSNYNYIKLMITYIIQNVVNTAAIIFACLMFNLNEGEIKDEEKFTKELC